MSIRNNTEIVVLISSRVLREAPGGEQSKCDGMERGPVALQQDPQAGTVGGLCRVGKLRITGHVVMYHRLAPFPDSNNRPSLDKTRHPRKKFELR